MFVYFSLFKLKLKKDARTDLGIYRFGMESIGPKKVTVGENTSDYAMITRNQNNLSSCYA